MSSLDVRPENRPKGVVAFPFRKFTGAKVNEVCAFMRFQSFLMATTSCVDDQITMLAKFRRPFSNLFFNFSDPFTANFPSLLKFILLYTFEKDLESFGFENLLQILI